MVIKTKRKLTEVAVTIGTNMLTIRMLTDEESKDSAALLQASGAQLFRVRLTAGSEPVETQDIRSGQLLELINNLQDLHDSKDS